MAIPILYWSTTVALVMLVVSLVLSGYRIYKGPRAQDRVMGADASYVVAALIVVVMGIRGNTTNYFPIALLFVLVGPLVSIALSKFLMRGEVIE